MSRKRRIKHKHKKGNKMDATKVSLSNRTRFEMNSNPLLRSRKAKSKFRQNKVLDYIRSKPTGSTFGMMELIASAGYGEKQYATGWAFINRMQRDKVIHIEHTTKFKKQVTIPGDSRTLTPGVVTTLDPEPVDTSPTFDDKPVSTTKNTYTLIFQLSLTDSENEFLDHPVAKVSLARVPLDNIEKLVQVTMDHVREVLDNK